MSAALVRPEGSVRRTHFSSLCGSLACQETGDHSHADCPECGRVLMPGLAQINCRTCRLACYGGPSRVYPVVLHLRFPDTPATRWMAEVEARVQRYARALAEITQVDHECAGAAIAARALGRPVLGWGWVS